MAFSAGAVLTAAQLNALSVTTIATTSTVGIGIASPDELLHVEGGTPTLKVSDTANNTGQGAIQCELLLQGRYHSGTADPTANNYSAAAIKSFKDNTDGSGGGGMSLWTSATGVGGLTQKVTIDKAGNFGIGTTSPSTPLNISSSGSDQFRLQNTTSTTQGPYISLYHSTGRIGYIGFPNNDDLHLKNESTAGEILMSTNNTTRFTVKANGQMSGNSGTAALPAYTFTSGSNNEGMFYLAGVTAIAAGGTTAMQVASNRTYVQGTSAAGGTMAKMVTQTVNSVSMKGLYYDASFAHLKSGVEEWGLTDEQFMAIDTPSYLVNGDHVTADGEHRGPSIEGDDESGWTKLPDPDGAQLLRRAGFMYENLVEVDLHLVTDQAPDEKAISAAIIAKVQELMTRVDTLEAA